ncbi:MAG: nucleotidyltransferase family protein [Gammaproteobacteria bacterium]|nr:nucleotidyltransferase family protein [Gammaproteobacteria bacterium]MCW5583450.1 nucleotidyltransferase family protein [Gammaproteobacteria bacterium]
MRAIILVGGLGTRLRTVVADVPKPMAPIQNKPFLAYLLHYLKQQGVTQIVFPTHYMGEKIRAYFQSHYIGMDIQYVEETQPLGTGGAIVNALRVMQDLHDPLLVLNGDTFLKFDYPSMITQHLNEGAALTMALRWVDDCSRYGKVITEHHRVVAFREKGEPGPGYINAGAYLINPTLFMPFDLPQQFSFENDFLLPHLSAIAPQSFITHDYFIDIGVPEDYVRAMHDLPILVGG